MLTYLGAYHGAFLFKEDDHFFMQVDNGAHQAEGVNADISAAETQRIMQLGRGEGDMAFQVNDGNVSPGVEPIWRTHPFEYLTWHRDNDPSPYAGHARDALVGLTSGNG